MTTYRAPQRDMRFVLHELLEVEKLSQLPGYEEATADVIDAVVEEGARFCEDMLFPINRTGDEQGCMYENGVVRTPAGFKKAYDRFVEGGRMGLAADPAHGGQGLPKAIKLVMDEMVCSANLAFSNYPGLSASAYLAIDAHAGDDLKARYLPKLASGAWSGTMCLTEPQCGTDLGLIRTRAEPNDDGTYAGIEHKMGINGSATCVMNFEGATGWLLGEPHRGMRAMFTMMNDARLDVGLQGLAIAETAYQSAVAYARERLQGRALSGATQPDQPADPIIVHPDVRRMLLTMRASSEGARALAYWIGMALDLARRQPDPAARQTADDLIALMTPIIKAYFTDQGSACANLGVQVMGGHGYIRECGMEQLVRDARITQLYEGANGIQALDLVGRKLPAHFGRHLRAFFHPVMAFIEQHQADPELAEFVLPLAKAYARLQQVTLHLAQQGLRDPNEAAAASYDYLRLFALVALAYLWARMVEVAKPKLAAGADGDASFYEAKVRTARFFMTKMLPESGALFAQIMAGGAPLMDFDAAAFLVAQKRASDA